MRFAIVIWLSALVLLGFFTEQNEFHKIGSFFLIAFVASLYIIQSKTTKLRDIIVVGLIIRVLLFFTTPSLSDDIYRFIWDGRMLLQGLNPFSYTPIEVKDLIDNGVLFDQLNSPSYFTVYPVICQGIFGISAWIGNSGIWISGMVIKLFLLIADLTILKLLLTWLKTHGQPLKRAMWYFINPLVIIETFDNLHFEVLMVAFLLLALTKTRTVATTALLLSASIATKLLPLMLVPYFVFRKNTNSSFFFLLILSGILIIFFSPLILAVNNQGFVQSVNLYFQTFEFNASFYYIFRSIGYYIVGYNTISLIGPIMALFSGLTILFISYKSTLSPEYLQPVFLLWIFTTYFLLSTTVHPWYIITPLAIGILTRYNFPIIWSLLAVISYQAYTSNPVEENMVWIVFEYGLLLSAIVYEVYKKRAELTSNP